jgi:hypothetical protein
MSDKAFELPLLIESVACGLRFEPRYEVLDKVGSVIDKILRQRGSPFDSRTFPYSFRDSNEHLLVNQETNERIRVTHSDCILEMKVQTREPRAAVKLAEDFERFVLEPLREIAGVRNIARYGLLIKLAEASRSIAISPVQHFLSADFGSARSLSLRFSRRLPAIEAIARRDVNDYRNVIYTIKQNEGGEVTVWVDYQEYFDPELSDREWRERHFGHFAERASAYFLAEFRDWLSKLLKTTEAA